MESVPDVHWLVRIFVVWDLWHKRLKLKDRSYCIVGKTMIGMSKIKRYSTNYDRTTACSCVMFDGYNN